MSSRDERHDLWADYHDNSFTDTLLGFIDDETERNRLNAHHGLGDKHHEEITRLEMNSILVRAIRERIKE